MTSSHEGAHQVPGPVIRGGDDGGTAGLIETGAFAARPCLSFLGKTSTFGDAADLTRRLAAGLHRQGLETGATLALFLPNCPLGIVTLLAAWRLGATVAVVDPGASKAALAGQLARADPAVVVTLDLGALLDRLSALLPALEPRAVVVGKMADLLPFPRNLLLPLLRGGGLATVPAEPPFVRLSRLLAAPEDPPPETPERAALLAPDGGTLRAGELVRAAGALGHDFGPARRFLLGRSLAEPEAVAAVLAGLARGAELVLSPRLDAASLVGCARATRPDLLIAGPPLEAALGAADRRALEQAGCRLSDLAEIGAAGAQGCRPRD